MWWEDRQRGGGGGVESDRVVSSGLFLFDPRNCRARSFHDFFDTLPSWICGETLKHRPDSSAWNAPEPAQAQQQVKTNQD